jgi:cysteinyl-tRNA synthetase
MAGKYLGEEFDIHGGGLDLRFPHHENELAQSAAAGRRFARVWMHNAMVTTAGEKMSKSLGNSALVSQVVQRFRPIELRYYLVTPHYRSVVEFSDAAVQESAAALSRLEGFVQRADEVVRAAGGSSDPATGEIAAEFAAALDDDLSTPAAIAVVHEVVRAGNKLLADGPADDPAALQGAVASVRRMLGVLGLDPLDASWSGSGAVASASQDRSRAALDSLVGSVLAERADARARRDWGAADAARDRLAQAGIEIEDTAAGPRWAVAEERTERAG